MIMSLLLLVRRSCWMIVWASVATTASNLYAMPPHRKPTMRGGNLEPAGHRVLRKYSETDHMPSLFSEDEETYDRYAACLAATEGLRRLRDRDITDEMQAAADAEDAKRKRKQIAAQYVQNSGKVLRALGMSVSEFNELGKEIARNDKLKEKVCLFRALALTTISSCLTVAGRKKKIVALNVCVSNVPYLTQK